jgi:hypothetical protein
MEGEMGWVFRSHATIAYRAWWEILKERDFLENLG